MKKIQSIMCGAAIAFSSLAASCDGGQASKVSLSSTTDTLAYSYGVNLAEQGLEMYLQQIGILTDTLQLQMSYHTQINATEDSLQKQKLQDEFKHKLDSVVKANKKNLKDVVKGLKEGFASKESDNAYKTGVDIGRQIAQQMLPGLEMQAFGKKDTLDKKIVLAAVINVLQKAPLAIENSQELFQNSMKAIQEEAQKKQDEELKTQYQEHIAQEEALLAENSQKEGVITLPSGVQYQIIKEGKGAKPTATDRVKVHYEGKLLNGTVFDSSYERGTPATLGVSEVIKGWTEVLQLIPVGSKFNVWIPYNLAYGSRDSGKIPPFSALTFQVELLDIE